MASEKNQKKLKKVPHKSVRTFKDSDGDGLSDYDEIHYFGSDPYNADSDGDGIEDGEAVLDGKDPLGGGSLKDFFIPHAGNNYRPKSLHPKRLLFHAGGILAAKLVVVLFVSFYPLAAWMTPDISAIEGQKIIALTNNLRQGLSLSPLTESPALDRAAGKKVEDMFVGQYFAHVNPSGQDLEYFLKQVSYNYITVGENLAMGFSDAGEVMQAWEKSPTHYSNLVDPNFKEIGVALAGGSYLQQDTVFAAQYFGLPQSEKNIEAPTQISPLKNSPSFKAGEKAVLSEKVSSKVDAKIVVDQAAGFKNEKVVKVEANLPAEVTSAKVQVLNNNIELTPSAIHQESSSTAWAGQALVQGDDRTITPPIMSLGTVAGETKQVEVSNNIIPQKTSVVSQYWLFKTHPNRGLAQVFGVSSIYFIAILFLALLAMILNIFIEIKKQHPKLILSGLGLIVLATLMVII